MKKERGGGTEREREAPGKGFCSLSVFVKSGLFFGAHSVSPPPTAACTGASFGHRCGVKTREREARNLRGHGTEREREREATEGVKAALRLVQRRSNGVPPLSTCCALVGTRLYVHTQLKKRKHIHSNLQERKHTHKRWLDPTRPRAPPPLSLSRERGDHGRTRPEAATSTLHPPSRPSCGREVKLPYPAPRPSSAAGAATPPPPPPPPRRTAICPLPSSNARPSLTHGGHR